MEKTGLKDILNNFKYIGLSIEEFEEIIPRDLSFRKRYISEQTREKLQDLNINYNIIKQIVIDREGIYYDLKPIFTKLQNRYSLTDMKSHSIKLAADKLKEVTTLDDLIKLFPGISYKHRLDNNIQKVINGNEEMKRQRKKIKKRMNPNDKNYHKRLEYIDNTHPVYENVEEKAKQLTLKDIKKTHLGILTLLEEYSKNDFEELKQTPDRVIKSISKKKLNLLLALKVMSYAKKSEKNSEKYKAFIEYLRDYIINNKELVNNNYYYYPYEVFSEMPGLKAYRVSTIVDFINTECEKKSNEKENDGEVSFFGGDTNNEFRTSGPTKWPSGGGKRKQEILKEKVDYYEPLVDKNLHIGINSFDGYLGFELDNGVVLIDKIYKTSERKEFSLEEAAVYITTVEEFEKFKNLSRATCIEKINNKELNAVRVFHNVGWTEVVDEKQKVFKKK